METFNVEHPNYNDSSIFNGDAGGSLSSKAGNIKKERVKVQIAAIDWDCVNTPSSSRMHQKIYAVVESMALYLCQGSIAVPGITKGDGDKARAGEAMKVHQYKHADVSMLLPILCGC